MGLETGTFPSDLIATNPTASDPKSQGDDHLRLLKNVFKMTLPNVTGAITATHTQLNYVTGVTSSIQGQFAGVQAQFTSSGALITGLQASKADLAGATYSGTHDFSGGITKVAPPTLADHAATMLYVQQQAFAAVLPSQPGNAGRYITTDGTNASWADLSGGVTTTVTAVNIQLTVASRQLQVITATADDVTVILPDATTIAAGGPIHTIYNKPATGAKSFTVRNKADAFLINVQPGQIATFYCIDKTTVAGFWFVGSETFTGGAMTDYAVAAGVAYNALTSTDTSIARVSDTVAIAAYRGSGNAIQAVCVTVTAVALAFGPVLTINATSSTLTSIAMMSATKSVLAYSGTSGYPEAVILTLTGNVLAKGAICNTISLFNTNTGLSVAALSSTQAIISYLGSGSYVQTSLLDAPATTITPSVTPLVVNTGVVSARPTIAALTSSKTLLTYVGATNLPTHVVIDIAGASMVPGPINTFGASVGAGARTALVSLSSTRAIFGFLNGALGVFVLDVAGTTVTPSALASGEGGFAGNQINFGVLSSTRIMVAYSSATNVRAALVTITGSVPVVGTNLLPVETGNYIAIVGLTTTKALAVFSGFNSYLNFQIIEKAE